MVRHQIVEESVNRKSKVKMTGAGGPWGCGPRMEEGQDIVSGQNRLIGKRNEGGKIQLLGTTFHICKIHRNPASVVKWATINAALGYQLLLINHKNWNKSLPGLAWRLV